MRFAFWQEPLILIPTLAHQSVFLHCKMEPEVNENLNESCKAMLISAANVLRATGLREHRPGRSDLYIFITDTILLFNEFYIV